jgi:hypothetical protein
MSPDDDNDSSVYDEAVMSRTHDVTISAFDLDRLEAELEAERALSDRLADALTNPAVYVAVDALMAWKEARSERR